MNARTRAAIKIAEAEAAGEHEVSSTPLFGPDDELRRMKQLETNCMWLIQQLDRIHAALCPGQIGTWQQRASAAVESSEKLGPNDKVQPPSLTRLAEAPGSSLYGVRIEVVGDDRLSCSAHLRVIADMIMRGDAPGWTTSDVNGSAMADRFAPNGD